MGILEKLREIRYIEEMREDIRRELLEPLRKIENLKKRQYDEKGSTDRPDYERDYTRVLYSSSFRRLQGKMQLLAVQNDKFFRNRLTHSLEVAQIARSIASEIGYLPEELYVVEAGALAHDIGNPPFGHYGEQILHELVEDRDGYEGNAQTLRVLTKLEKKAGHDKGLNLTNRTILSVLKYNKTLKQCKDSKLKTKYIYKESYELIKKIKEETNVTLRTLDVQIVDASDEIAYAAHDLEDGLAQGIFTIDEVLFSFKKMYPLVDVEGKENEEHSFVYQVLEAIINNAKAYADKHASTNAEYSALLNNKISSSITFYLINDLGLVEVTDEVRKETASETKYELDFVSLKKLAKGLKDITYKCVCNSDKVYLYEQAGKKIITSLFKLYSQIPMYLPEEYRISRKDMDKVISLDANQRREQEPEIDAKLRRNIVDHISGMMDSFAISEYERFFGESGLNGFYSPGDLTDCKTLNK